MKKILFPIVLLLFLVRPQLKAQAPASLNSHYRGYYQIFDSEKGYSIERKNPLLGNPTYNGGDIQQWIVMPTYVGSTEYYIANKSNGTIMVVNSVYVTTYDGYTDGANNQIMKLNQVTSSGIIPKFSIGSAENSQKTFTRSNSVLPIGLNNILFKNYNGGANQLFVFNPVSSFTSPLWEYRTKNNVAIAQPPSPTNLQGQGLCNECNETFKAEAILPFTIVENDMSRTQQAMYSPFYRLEYKQVWRLVGSKIFQLGDNSGMKVMETVGTSDTYVTDITKTLKVSFSATQEINFTLDKLIGGKVASALGISYDKTTRSINTHVENYSKTIEVTTSYTPTSQTLIAEYQLIDRYRLYRSDGTKIKEWDVALDPRFNTRVSYVCGSRCRVAQPGEIVVKSQSYSSDNTYQVDLANANELEHNADFVINSVSPNPFQSSVKIDLWAPESANVQIELYNLLGQKVKHIDKVISLGGNTSLEVDGSNLQDGLYVIKVEAIAINDRKKKFSYQQKLILRK